MPIEVLLSDPDVAHNFRLDKLERKSGFHLMRGLAAQLDPVTGTDTFKASKIPDDLHIDKVSAASKVFIDFASGEDPRVQIGPDGESQTHLILPTDWKWADVLAILHVLDRGSVGRCAVWYGGTKGRMLWSWRWGQNHDDWNAVKATAHEVDGGRIWASIVKFSGIMNLHCGPFKSGAWGRQLQEVHQKLKNGLLSVDSDAFRYVAQKQFELYGEAFWDAPGNSTLANSWDRFCNLRLIVIFMHIVKFARWGSIDDAWNWARRDIWLSRPVFEGLRDERQVGELTGLGTAQYDLEAGSASAPKGGLVDWAARNITDELCLSMDVYSVVSAPVRDRQSRRAVERKTVEKGLQHELKLMQGGFEDTYKAIIGGVAEGSQHLRPWDDDRFKPYNVCKLYHGFMGTLVRELCLRELPELFGPHNKFVFLLAEGETALEWRDQLAKNWVRVLEVEQLASRGDRAAIALLADIPLLSTMWVRLGFYVVCRDRCRHPNHIGEDAMALARSTGHRIYDEKAAEDLHQFVRDLARAKRAKNVGISTCFNAVRTSGVLEARGVDHPQLDASAVAQESFTTQNRTAFGYLNKPKHWDNTHNQILSDSRDWPSPTTSGLLTGQTAWDFLQSAFDKLDLSEDANPTLELSAKWWSGCVPDRVSMCHDDFQFKCFTLHSSKWAFLCVELEEVVDNEGPAFRMSIRPRPGTDLIKSMTIDDPRSWKVWTPSP